MTNIGVGHYDKQGNACLSFHLCGTKHEVSGVEYVGIIDTGFTGFIQLPLQHAFSLALPLEGTVSVTLADGSRLAQLTALALATLSERTEMGTVILSLNSETILLGMDFLRRFDRALVVSKGGIVLIDDEDFAKGLEEKLPPSPHNS